MKTLIAPGFSLRLIAFAVLALFAGAGCVPDVAWLPDSSGIIYTSTDWPGMRDMNRQHKGRLIHYDLAKKSHRVIAETETNTIQPALSPDGKRIAVARLNKEKANSPTLQVVVYDLQGKEVHRSKAFDWGEQPVGEASFERYPQLFWAPQGSKVLVYANKHTGIYDLQKDEAVMLGAAIPAIYGATAMLPDGKGFLLAKGAKKVSLVDWEGNESAIELPAGEPSDPSIVQTPAAVCWARWEGNVAVATWKGGELRIDTAKKTAAVRKVDRAAWAWDGKEIQQLHTFPDGKSKLVVAYLKSTRDFRDAGLATVRVYLVDGESGQSRTLIEETFHCGVFPSPNKELVALRYASERKNAQGNPRDMILVVNKKCEVVAEFNAGK